MLADVRRLFLVMRRVEAAILAAAMIAMVVVTCANVVARNVRGEGLAAAEELNGFLIVVISFVGLSYAAGHGRHIRMSALSDALPARRRRWLLCAVTATTALLLFTLAWYAARYALGVDRTSPVLGVPLRRVYLIAPVGLCLGGLQYVLAAVRNARGPDAYLSFDRVDGFEELAAERDRPAEEG
jgi:TRAP-type C4-dicarboxylate transport system permease small subunit